jgi:CDP-paratose 2-epimerase
MSSILITGGLGFIGSACARELALNFNNTIYIIDNFSRIGAERRFLELSKYSNIKIIKSNINNIDSVFSNYFKVDTIIHCAAQVAVTTSIENPILDFDTNAYGTLHVLEWMRKSRDIHKNNPIIIYSSTNKVYGSLDDINFIKNDSRYANGDCNQFAISESFPTLASTPYGVSKYVGELLVREWSKTFNLKTIIFRKSCIYGVDQEGIVDQGWVSFIKDCIKKSGSVDIFGDGCQVRDLLEVRDLVRLYLLVINNSAQLNDCEIFNVGGGFQNSHSVNEVTNLLSSQYKINTKIIYHPWRLSDQKYFVSDLSYVNSKLGWSPSIDLKNVLKDGF